MNESKHANIIKWIKSVHEEMCEYFNDNAGTIPHESHSHRGELLEIVDSQAQKIAEQAKEISAQNVELINLRYNLQTARIQAEGVRADIICGETSYLRQYLDGHEFPWEKTDSKEVSR